MQKEQCWNAIATHFNSSANINQRATPDQLRRLWQNFKNRQRDGLVQERQHRMATGGGGPCPDASIDPDIAEIAPAVMVEVVEAIDSDSAYTTQESIEEQYEIQLPQTNHPPPITPQPTLSSSSINPMVVPTHQTSPILHNTTTNTGTGLPPHLAIMTEKQLRMHIIYKEHQDRLRRAKELHKLDVELKN